MGNVIIAPNQLPFPSPLPSPLFNSNAMLSPSSKIQMYESAVDNRVDETAFNAAKAIRSLVSNLTEKDVVIVLCSGMYNMLYKKILKVAMAVVLTTVLI